MGKNGNNIHQRKDGRWEGRYKKGYKDNGTIIYGSVYGKTYAEVVVCAKNLTEHMFRRGMRLFFDVTDSAPCTVIPESLFVLLGVMVGAQRRVAKLRIRKSRNGRAPSHREESVLKRSFPPKHSKKISSCVSMARFLLLHLNEKSLSQNCLRHPDCQDIGCNARNKAQAP